MFKNFNNALTIVEGWYWTLRSRDIPRGRAKPFRFANKDLVLYRGQDGRVVAMDAYCPHMGAHLALGRVEGTSLRCFFHYWKYNNQGQCIEIPALEKPVRASVETWPVEEKYGLIWVWTGKEPRHPVPCVPELENKNYECALANRFIKNCHPHVVMINAIDEHHFASVHDMSGKLYMENRIIHEGRIEFQNTQPFTQRNIWVRLLKFFYKQSRFHYIASYWYGSTGTVTAGPDFLHAHLIFALRPTEDGKTEGQTILITEKRKGLAGFFLNKFSLFLSRLVGYYFAEGDTRVFKSIRFELKTPIKTDHAVLAFIRHVEGQKTAEWDMVTSEIPATENHCLEK
jgi:phenylpropionate dioxygenase-like ring-hydroxylating dioxygenase large terminal subunit